MSRPALLALGLAALALAWTPWTGAVLGHGFTAHMARHMTVVAVAAPLIALGLAGGRFDPSARHPLLFAAVPASLIELFVVWGWHAPAAHDLARSETTAYLAEQASFLIAGLWVWLACFGHSAVDRTRRAAEGAVAMLLTSIHMTLLGALLAMSVRPLYAAHHAGHGSMALDDQHLGGIVMLMVGGAVYLAGGVALVARLLKGHDAGAPQGSPAP
ncbi:cytochrome c oxidase assembly protein [Hansschlegelia zhihuaiae]|uniref:Cytochrome c oxidase assembly protein n=1 Tax=Hansschlegelia zhihuaiae TaxID=405005 RepID=A0A4Q0MIT1_9HYPH|nr:cytochrome c oxidase assembly protein [Hansschlegelia zhihuaiae]RXF72959.1 cytochrome c oxidase assembly protein [Hansschlegelia zhihuaiae]